MASDRSRRDLGHGGWPRISKTGVKTKIARRFCKSVDRQPCHKIGVSRTAEALIDLSVLSGKKIMRQFRNHKVKERNSCKVT